MNAAAQQLLVMAEVNGGGFEPRDVLGPGADTMDHAALFGALDQHVGLAECLKAGTIVAMRDEELRPPVVYLLTPAGEAQLHAEPPDPIEAL